MFFVDRENENKCNQAAVIYLLFPTSLSLSFSTLPPIQQEKLISKAKHNMCPCSNCRQIENSKAALFKLSRF